MTLHPWRVHDGDDDYTWKWLAWAPDSETARTICLGDTEAPSIDDMTAEREHSLESQDGEPFIEGDYSILRDLGFMCESDSSCDTCGLYEMDGEFPVCDECGQCPDCGHSDYCETGKEEVSE